MGILDNFEKGLERAVNGAFAKTFRSGLQPVEIGSALKRELDTKAAIVSRDRILVPNSFEVHLAPSDFQRMSAIGPTLVDDLTGIVQKHSADQGFQFAGGLSVGLVEDPKLSTGVLEIESSTVQRDVTWVPVLDVAGKRHPLKTGRTIIGRGREADITVEDTGISRKHLEFQWDGRNAEARDLDSTNGSQLNGQPLTRAIVAPDSVIQIGRTRVVFRVLAQAAEAALSQAPGAGAPAPFSAPGSPSAPPPSSWSAYSAPAGTPAPDTPDANTPDAPGSPVAGAGFEARASSSRASAAAPAAAVPSAAAAAPSAEAPASAPAVGMPAPTPRAPRAAPQRATRAQSPAPAPTRRSARATSASDQPSATSATPGTTADAPNTRPKSAPQNPEQKQPDASGFRWNL